MSWCEVLWAKVSRQYKKVSKKKTQKMREWFFFTKSDQMLRVGSWERHASVKRNKLRYVGSFRIFFNKKSCRSEKMLDLTYLLLLIWLIHHVFHNVNIYEASFLIHFLYIILIIQWQWYVKIPIESIMKIILQQLPWRHFRV